MIRTVASLLLLGLAATAADEPGAAALAYLESLRKTRAGAVQADAPQLDATAASRFVGKQKRLQLSRQITLLAGRLHAELPFQIEASRTDRDLAAVLLRQWQANDPDGPRWFPLALVLRDGCWLPAPIPGSFENALYGYDSELRQRARTLERWLMRERATSDMAMLDRQLAEMRERMAASIPEGLLASEQPGPVLDHFLAACERRDVDAALALLGGMQPTLPDDWPQLHRAVFDGLGNNPDDLLAAPWRLLHHPQVARAVLKTGPGPNGSKVAHLGCLDPTSNRQKSFGFDQAPRIVSLPLRMHRSEDQRWLIRLPECLLIADPPAKPGRRSGPGNWFAKLVAANDQSTIARFPSALQKVSPPRPAADQATLANRVVKTLGTGDFTGLLRLLRLAGDPQQSILGHERAAELWSELFHPEKHGTLLLLDHVAAGSSGALALHIFSPTRPEAADLRILRTVHNERGWWLAPSLLDPEAGDPAGKDPLAGQLALAEPRWNKTAPAKILDSASRIGGLPVDRAPTSQQARDTVNAWHRAVLDGDPVKAVAHAAVFDNPRSTSRLLRSLGHELIGARRNPQPGMIIAANQSGRWAAVSLRINTPTRPTFPFYAVVLADDGPRVLPEIELFHGGSRSRSFLNRAAWSRLGDLLPESAVTELRSLFDQHSDLVDVTAGDQPGVPDKDDDNHSTQ